MSTSREPRTPTRRSTFVGVVAGVVVLALVAGGAFAVVGLVGDRGGPDSRPSTGASTTPDPDLPATDPALEAYYGQRLAWSSCFGDDECTSIRVPLDYDAPGGRSIELRMLKVPATGDRLGSLVVNPGGPGGSAVQYAQSGAQGWPADLLARYDLVGVDPRGIGQSTALECGSTAENDQLVASDPDPDDRAERDRLDALVERLGRSCVDADAGLARHVSTVEVARDLDVLRHLLGESRLDYFGASYGTRIGATYADLFPGHVGRMVLDGAVDPGLSAEQLNLQQAHGFETALRAYVRDCVDRGRCILGDSVATGTRRIRSFLDEVERAPLPTNGDRDLEVGNAVTGIWLPLYARSYWPLLTSALTQAIDEGDGTGLLSLSDQLVSRSESGYEDNSLEALYAVNCLDQDPGDSIATDDVPSRFPAFDKASPTFGRAFAYSLSTCAQWPVPGTTPRTIRAAGAPPIVVVGTTRDPATPYRWAKALASRLESGVLVSRDGDGHTGYHRGNACVDAAVTGFLVAGDVPKDGLRC